MPVRASDALWNLAVKELGFDEQATGAGHLKSFIAVCNPERFENVVERLTLARREASRKGLRNGTLAPFEQALLESDHLPFLAISFYDEELASTAQLFPLFNLFEDALRSRLHTHYQQKCGEFWFKDEGLLTRLLTESQYSAPGLAEKDWTKVMSAATRAADGHALLSKLDLLQLSLLCYSDVAWTTHRASEIFSGKRANALTTGLKELSQGAVYDKLSTVRWRRNAVYHHNPIARDYTLPPRGTHRTQRRSDGTISNTRKRLMELLDYLTVPIPEVQVSIKRISGGEEASL